MAQVDMTQIVVLAIVSNSTTYPINPTNPPQPTPTPGGGGGSGTPCQGCPDLVLRY